MIVIYGLRLKGDCEVRYVGRTADMTKRLAGHIATAKQMPWKTNFAEWLLENSGEIETVQLNVAADRTEACALERAAVQFCLALDHRLFNQWLVPAEKRASQREGERSQRSAWTAPSNMGDCFGLIPC